MTYVLLSLPFLIAAAVVAWALRPRDPGAARRRRIATIVAAIVLVVLTAVFDSVIIATGIVAYDDSRRLGWAVGLAPVEDFLYPLAGVLLLPAVWAFALRRWPPRHADPADPRSPGVPGAVR